MKYDPRSSATLWCLIAFAFTAAYGQAPLFYSNQNQYFLHGLAAAGDGFLADDWLANTDDPTPIFSLLVSLTARVSQWLFHVELAILAGVNVAGLVGVFVGIVGRDVATRRWPVFLAALVAVHAALGRWLSYEWLGRDYLWYFQAGVAGQYVLGPMLQPSVFGVLLVAAVGAFFNGYRRTAAVLVATAATVHPTYLLPGALLTAGFLAARLVDKDVRGAVSLGALTFGLVLPVVVFVLWRFGPTTAESYRESQRILVDVRIPHHCRPDLWFDPIAGLQIAWLALSLVLARRTTLFPILATSSALATILTVVQIATGSDTLALLFPWRLSAILMPIATAIALSRLVAIERCPFDDAWRLPLAVVVVLAAAGLWIAITGRAFRTASEEQPLYDFVRGAARKGDVYLLPVSIPDLATKTRGSSSSDFKSPAVKRLDPRDVPPDLQRFRLATGAPIFVDFKAIPYRDVDVLAWRRRLALAEDWRRSFAAGKSSETVPHLRQFGVTHVVVPATTDLAAPEFLLEFPGESHRVYRLAPHKTTP